MIAILDADSLLYAIGSINIHENIVSNVLDNKIKNILSSINMYNVLIVIQGKRNFRNKSWRYFQRLVGI